MTGRIGDYLIDGELPAGGTDQQFEARHVVLPRRALVRIAHSPRALELMREACILEAMHHPGVPRVYECGLIDGCPWLAIEDVEGQPLARAEKLPVPAVAQLVRDVATILAKAHRRGVTHRNVRPETIVRCDPTRGFAVCLVNWSDARLPDSSRPDLHLEDDYVAPEGAVDARADIYALGTVAYELLTGTLPSLPLARRAPALPPKLAALVERMLSGTPSARPSANEVIEVLKGDLDEVEAEEVKLDVDLSRLPDPAIPRREKVRWTPAYGLTAQAKSAHGTPIAILKPRT